LEAYLPPPNKDNHASNLEFLPNGDLNLAWFNGIGEGEDLCSIAFA